MPKIAVSDYLYLDFETEPDATMESRWGLGPILQWSELMKPKELLKGTVPDVKTYISSRELQLPNDWLEEVQFQEEAAKNRSGVMDTIWEAYGARSRHVAGFALDPELCYISLAAFAQDGGAIQTWIGRYGQEKAVIKEVWDIIRRARTIVGFNIFSFDIRVLLSRSAHHGVVPPVSFNLNPWVDPWSYPGILDLMVARFGRDKAKKLKVWAKDLGLEPLSAADGSQVSSLSDEELHLYGESDIDITRAIHQKLGGYYWPAVDYPTEDEIPF